VSIFYTSALSPFGARLRMVAALTGATLPDIVAPPGGTGSAAMKAIHPFGQTPAIQIGETVLIESLALMEYVIETGPASDLLPSDPVLRARARGVALAHDHQVVTVMRPLLRQFQSPTPDLAIVTEGFVALNAALGALTRLFDPDGLVLGARLSIADIAIAPFAFLCDRLGARFGVASPYAQSPRAAAWWAAARAVPAIAADTQRRADELTRLFAPKPSAQS
jgi:glutathione S-transferase